MGPDLYCTPRIAYSEGAGQIAAIVKLARVALLAPVLTVVAFFLPREGGEGTGATLPLFVIGFFGMAGVNSLGLIPSFVAEASCETASAFLAAAVTATAIGSPLPGLLEAGPRPLLVVLASTVVAFALSLLAALVTIR